jgi:hypothetical protein
MPLDGLRAWIGEVERKLGMRTRVFLVLATIAIGGAGAAIYLAVDTRENAVSESDVQELQERLEGRDGTDGATGGAGLSQPEGEANTPGAKVEGSSASDSSESNGRASGGTGEPNGGASAGAGSNSMSNEASAVPEEAPQGQLGKLLEEAEAQNERAEAEQGK